MTFSTSAIFCFTLLTLAKHFPLRTFFIQGGKQKKSRLGWDQVNRKVRHGGRHAAFGQKRVNGMGRCACRSPIMKWANVLSLQKISLKLNVASQQCQPVLWYRWVSRTLTLQGKPAFQGAHYPEDNSGFWVGSPVCIYLMRGREVKHRLVASCTHPNWGPIPATCVCPDWESNLWPTETYWPPGPYLLILGVKL